MGKEIFILEDDRDIGFILTEVLLEEGYRVRLFETLASIRLALVSGMPDLLLMDVRLPDGSGMDLCRELKDGQTFKSPILMMSADWHVRNHDCPAEGYIAKPFNLDVLIQKIGSTLGNA
ncbi:response regulator transcription factor [Pedobacter sp. PWIIR3]